MRETGIRTFRSGFFKMNFSTEPGVRRVYLIRVRVLCATLSGIGGLVGSFHWTWLSGDGHGKSAAPFDSAQGRLSGAPVMPLISQPFRAGLMSGNGPFGPQCDYEVTNAVFPKVRGTADPSTVSPTARRGRRDRSVSLCRKTFPRKGRRTAGRFAPVGMTRKGWRFHLRLVAGGVNCRSLPLRSPGFPVDLVGFGKGRAPFFTERRIRGRCEFCVAGNPGTLRSG